MGMQPMPISPPCTRKCQLQSKTVVRDTHSLGVGAADGGRRAGSAVANADDIDRRASQAEQAGDGPEDDAEQSRQQVSLRGRALWAIVSHM